MHRNKLKLHAYSTNTAVSDKLEDDGSGAARPGLNQLENILQSDGPRTVAEKNTIWRAWIGMSDDLQATRLQLLDSILRMLQTEEPQDARKLRSLLDSKTIPLDSRQTPFYSFWAHMILEETDIAFRHFQQLLPETREAHALLFMKKLVECGDWPSGIRLWYETRNMYGWHGNPSIRQLLALIPNLHTWQFLSVLGSDQAKALKPLIRPAVVLHLAAQNKADAALQSVEEARDDGQILADIEVAHVIQCLARLGRFEEGFKLYDSVRTSASCPSKKHRMSLSALYAACNSRNLPVLYRLLSEGIMEVLAEGRQYVRIKEAYTKVMVTFANLGMVDMVEHLFNQFLKLEIEPDVYILGSLLQASVVTLEVERARAIFESCETTYGVKPDRVMHNMLLHMFSDTLDVSAALDVMQMLKQLGAVPDVYTASTMINLYARRKDPAAAENVFHGLLDLGLVPNSTVFGSLLHAYVEANDLEGMYDVLHRMELAGLKFNHTTMNIILKGLSKSGRPSKELFEFVASMEVVGFRPSSVTYTTLLRAEVQQGSLVSVLNLFNSIKSPNEFHYTALMVALVKNGTAESYDLLLQYYNQMLTTKLHLSDITLAVLVNAFVLQKSPEAAQKIDDLLDSLDYDNHLDLTSKHSPRTQISPNILEPLLRKSKSRTVQLLSANKIFQNVLQSVSSVSHKVDIRTLTGIMHAYATAGQQDKVKALFTTIKQQSDRLYQATTDRSTNEQGLRRDATTAPTITPAARFTLVAPLTIYMSTMVRARQYHDIEELWSTMSAQRYEFDDLNWNQYIGVQIAQGNIERAFDLVSSKLLVTSETNGGGGGGGERPLSLDRLNRKTRRGLVKACHRRSKHLWRGCRGICRGGPVLA